AAAAAVDEHVPVGFGVAGRVGGGQGVAVLVERVGGQAQVVQRTAEQVRLHEPAAAQVEPPRPGVQCLGAGVVALGGVPEGFERVVVAGGAVDRGGRLQDVALAQRPGLVGLVILLPVGGVGVDRRGRPAGVAVLVQGGDAAVDVLAIVVHGGAGRLAGGGAGGAAVAHVEPLAVGVVEVALVGGQRGRRPGAVGGGGLVVVDGLLGQRQVGEGGGPGGPRPGVVGFLLFGDPVQRVVDVAGTVGLGAAGVVAPGGDQVIEVVVGVDLPQVAVGGGAVGVTALLPAGYRRGGHAQQPAQVVVPVLGGARRVGLGGLPVAGVAAGDRRPGVLGLGGDVAGPDRRIRGGAPRRGAVQGVGGLGAVPVVAGDQLVAGVIDVA